MLEPYQKELIKEVFAQCYGLQEGLSGRNVKTAIHSLAARTGIRESFIEKNLTQIIKLKVK